MTPPTKTEGPQMLGRTFRKTKAPPTNKMKGGLNDVGREEKKGQNGEVEETKLESPLPHIPSKTGRTGVSGKTFCTKGISVMECHFLFLSSHLAMKGRDGLELRKKVDELQDPLPAHVQSWGLWKVRWESTMRYISKIREL